jgi:hypothetical protein
MTISPTSRHERLLAGGVSFAKQLLRVDPYFQSFSTNSSWLPFLSVPTNSIKNWTSNYFIQPYSSSSIIMGYHGQLIKQSRITVRGRQSIDLNLARSTQTHGRLPPQRQLSQAVPKNPRVGMKGHSLWCRLSGIPREIPEVTIHHR